MALRFEVSPAKPVHQILGPFSFIFAFLFLGAIYSHSVTDTLYLLEYEDILKLSVLKQ